MKSEWNETKNKQTKKQQHMSPKSQAWRFVHIVYIKKCFLYVHLCICECAFVKTKVKAWLNVLLLVMSDEFIDVIFVFLKRNVFTDRWQMSVAETIDIHEIMITTTITTTKKLFIK